MTHEITGIRTSAILNSIKGENMKKIKYRSFREQFIYCHGRNPTFVKPFCDINILPDGIMCVILKGFCHSKKCYKERRLLKGE